ncbi:MAG: MerR family transcriptional regulator [Bacteroidales bacterium]|nr:MerR family transcriptional regulator [Bacteroidales bacterium]MDD3011724.1 MerR family transcriptional regulator [Bacteroidales bacterium]MDD3961795.1 MerR family transcriptional regulator [Bacteroidales bacterium]MDY0285104.1 MerR family transcriptional regulator [Bacteroidales bacterium]
MADYSIKNLEALTGIKAQTIRVWERRYNLFSPERTATNLRKYSDNDLVKLLNISVLIQHNYKISKLASMDDPTLKTRVLQLKYKPFLHHTEIGKLLAATIEWNEKAFFLTLENNIRVLGFEETILNVVFPFLSQIGLLWQTGNMYPAQEHFVSLLIRDYFIQSIKNIPATTDNDAPLTIFFLPEGESHELSLLFYHYIAKKEGHRVIYLGQNVPKDDLKRIARFKKPNNLFTALISSISGIDIRMYILDLAQQFAESNIYLTGGQLKKINFPLPRNVFIVSSPDKFRKYYKN